MYRRLFKLFILLIVVFLCIVFFFSAKRVKGPAVSFELFDYLKGVTVESAIFKALDDSFIPKETIKGWQEDADFTGGEDFIYFKYILKHQPLLDTKSLMPLELHLFRGDAEVAFADADVGNKPNFSWCFVLNKKNSVYAIEASKMTPSHEGVASKTEKGLMLWKTGSIAQAIELPEGSKEFSITAANSSNFESNTKLDPHMTVYLDTVPIGDTYVRSKKTAEYHFYNYTTQGWHKLMIEFDNAYYNKDTGWDSNLFLKDVEIFELRGAVYLGVRKGLEAKLASETTFVSYFRSLDTERRNHLLRFFKSRFSIDDLREILMRGYSVFTLVRDVEINGLIKKAIFAPVPTKIKLPLEVPRDGIRLVFGYGVMEEGWDKAGDGVQFLVRLAEAKPESGELLFSKYIDPKNNEKDRKWFRGEVDLTRFKGQNINLVFETKGSPDSPIRPGSDDSYDWAVWSE